MQAKNSSIVDGIKYTGHAFDQMQADGIMSSLASVSQHGVEKAGLNAQQMLKSLESSINAATQHGIIYDKPIKSGNWELIFSPGRNPGDLPVLKHAVPNF